MTDSPVAPQVDGAGRQLQTSTSDRTATRVAKLLHRIAADEIEKYEQSRLLPFPFYVDAELLRSLQSEILQLLSRVPSGEQVEFSSETRFQDFSKIRFTSFDEFLEKAGNEKDPEAVEIAWSTFALDERGEPIAGEVRLQLVTEKRMHSQDFVPGDFNHAYVKVIVEGSDRLWVENAFRLVLPYVQAAKLGGIYRPLWFLRNKWFITMLAQVLSWIGFFIGIHFALQTFLSNRPAKEQVFARIAAEADLPKKLDALAQEILLPSRSPWWEPIAVVGCGAVTYAMIFILGMASLPKLSPNSSIAIGLSSRRARQYMNTFKFVVFTILVSGFLVPLIRALVKHLF